MRWIRGLVFLLLLSLVCLPVGSPVQAATITVTTLADSLAANGQCSLREAIANANNDALTHADCVAGSGADTIVMNVSGTYTMMDLNYSVTSNITIEAGVGVNAVIDGNGVRLFAVSTANGNLTLNGLTLQNGSSSGSGGCIQVGANSTLQVNTSLLQSCVSGTNGGAIGTVGGIHTITISGSTLQNNTANFNGGAVFHVGAGTSLTVTNSTFNTNRSGAAGDASGGALFFNDGGNGFLSINGSTFNGNLAQSTTASAYGGALLLGVAATTSATISGSTFTNNQAFDGADSNRGGALYKTGLGTLTITGSVFTSNSVSGTQALGGAIFNNQGSLTVNSSRLESNSTALNGGAYYSVSNGIDSLTASCIVNNGDLAVVDIELANAMIATGNWWGSSWGPRIPVLSGSGSAISTGDSISGNGITLVDVDLTSSGGNPGPAPTGDWLLTAPNVAGATCLSCTNVSSVSPAGACF